MRNKIGYFVAAAIVGAVTVGGLVPMKGAHALERGSWADCNDVDYGSGRIYSCAGDQLTAVNAVVVTYQASGGSAVLCEWTGASDSCGAYTSINSNSYIAWPLGAPATRGSWPEVHVVMPNRTTSRLVGFIISE